VKGLPYRKNGPCGECPWRKDVEPGKFPAERYDALRGTSEQIEPTCASDISNQGMFACHMTHEGREQACAGWLAVAAHNHIGVRLAVATGRLPAQVLGPGEDWPELFGSYDEMAKVQGRPAAEQDGEKR